MRIRRTTRNLIGVALAIVSAVFVIRWVSSNRAGTLSIHQLRAELHKRDSVFSKAAQSVWDFSPQIIREWFPSLRPTPAATVRSDAALGLAELGRQAQAAVPELIEALNDPDARVRRASIAALGEAGAGDGQVMAALLRIFDDSSEQPDFRGEAFVSLMKVGAENPAVLARLSDILAKPRGAGHVSEFAYYITPGLEKIEGPKPMLAATLFQYLRVEQQPLPRVEQLRFDPSNPLPVRFSAGLVIAAVIRNLPRIAGHTNATLVPAILPFLSNPEVITQTAAIGALARLGSKAARALPDLRRVYRKCVEAAQSKYLPQFGTVPNVQTVDDIDEVHPGLDFKTISPAFILRAIGRITGPEDAESCAFLEQAMRGVDNPWRYDAAMALWHVRRQPDLSALLEHALRTGPFDLRARITRFIPNLRPEGLGLLELALADAETGVRIEAVESLKFFPIDHRTAAAWKLALDNSRVAVRFRAAKLLGSAGASAAPAIPWLKTLLRSTNSLLQSEARIAIGDIEHARK